MKRNETIFIALVILVMVSINIAVIIQSSHDYTAQRSVWHEQPPPWLPNYPNTPPYTSESTTFDTRDSPADILAFYDHELLAVGWEGGISTETSSSYYYYKKNEGQAPDIHSVHILVTRAETIVHVNVSYDYSPNGLK